MSALGLSPKQETSIREATGAVNVWDGSVRSGKTIASLLRWAMYVATSKRTGQLVVVGRTRDSVARNVFAPLQDPALFGPLAKQVHYTPGAPTATMYGYKVWVLGTSDTRSENVLRGLTCAGAYVDEATLVPEAFFVQLLNRMWDDAQLFATTNPDNPQHWLKRIYLDRIGTALPDWRRFQFNLDDNPALSEARKDRIRRENVGLYYRRFVLGEWVAAEGAVYDTWDPDRHQVKFDLVGNLDRLVLCGVDYGTQNASAALLLGVTRQLKTAHPGVYAGRRLVLLDEWRYDAKTTQRRLTDAEQSKRLLDWYTTEQHVPKRSLSTGAYTDLPGLVVDPAAASFKVQLLRDGAGAVGDADNDVLYGVRLVNSLIATDTLLVTDRCSGFLSEVGGYSWDDKAALKGEDKPIKVADHSLDAARYAICTSESLWRGLGVDPGANVVP